MHTSDFESDQTMDSSVAHSNKWRRRGLERRQTGQKSADYVEKRSSGDRRRHLLQQVSKVIFPRGKDGYGF